MRSRILALAGAVLLLAGCTEVKDAVAGPDPEPTAGAFVEALAAQDLSGAPVADPEAAERERAEVVDGMGGVTPRVGLLDLDESGDTATATLQWSWPVASGAGAEWSYESSLRLEREGDGWVAVWAPSVVEPSLVEGETLDLTTLTPRRGDIKGARGLAVVTQRPVNRIGIDKTLVGAARAVQDARALAEAVGIDAAAYVKSVKAAGDAAFVEAIVLRAEDVSSPMSTAISRLKGARRIAAEIPLAPSRDFAAPILGSVGQVTAEMVEEDPDTYRPGDVAGLSGLQARYDDQLRGTPGASVDVVPAEGSGAEVREVFRAEPEQGSTLKVSLDVDLQAEAEAVLRRTGPASALVAIDPRTGAVLAAANGPGACAFLLERVVASGDGKNQLDKLEACGVVAAAVAALRNGADGSVKGLVGETLGERCGDVFWRTLPSLVVWAVSVTGGFKKKQGDDDDGVLAVVFRFAGLAKSETKREKKTWRDALATMEFLVPGGCDLGEGGSVGGGGFLGQGTEGGVDGNAARGFDEPIEL